MQLRHKVAYLFMFKFKIQMYLAFLFINKCALAHKHYIVPLQAPQPIF